MVNTMHKPSVKVKGESKPSPKKPRDVYILLSVCTCFNPEPLTLSPARAKAIAQILRISVQKLATKARAAVITGEPQIVGCYTPEVAETILNRLDRQMPFIYRSCHKFFSQRT